MGIDVAYIFVHTYIHTYARTIIKEKEAIDLKEDMGGVQGRVGGSWVEGRKGGRNDVILFQLKTYFKSLVCNERIM